MKAKSRISQNSRLISEIPVEVLSGLGEAKKKALDKIGIHTIEDLLYFFPRRYVDRSFHEEFFLKEGNITLIVKVQSSFLAHGRKSRLMVQCKTLKGNSLTLIFFNGLQYYRYAFQKEKNYVVSGKLEIYKGSYHMIHPEVEAIDEEDIHQAIHSGGIIPIYSTTEALKKVGLDSRGFRRLIHQVLQKIEMEWVVPEIFPEEIRKKYKLPSRKDAIKQIHYPESRESYRIANRTLKFEELFLFGVLIHKKKETRKSFPRQVYPLSFGESKLFEILKKNLPFELTNGQQQAIQKMLEGSKRPYMSAFLLQGDVGSGKTLVAFSVALHYIEKGYQVALMAPTELLARQHYNTLSTLPGFIPGVQLDLLTGSETKKNKEIVLDRIKRGDSNFIIGTHSLIEPNVEFHSLGLVIIDEQHRFGVQQRENLRQKGKNPDLIAMTATPIPRSLCLTIFGDLELVYLKEKPAGRKPVKTMWLREHQREGLYKSIRKYLQQGRQCYIVYPVIEESEKLDLKAATEAYEELKTQIFPEFRVELIHGRMKPEERDKIMRDFRNGKVHILVSTTVIEVGVDVPNATIMVIENAERFGLSQLHQLRGRVGRGTEESFCVLVSNSDSSAAKARLQAIVEIQDGFELAEIDLKIRGPGELLGTKQHGLPDFRLSDFVKDRKLMEIAYSEATQYPHINEEAIKFLKKSFSEGVMVFPN
ncbi:MAG: ATP-dependent DNA helicase RecG [Leptospiraceae bacterium]|nr:ATP-dependent DNA helicase RecG [Leptospiraceae bacterium]MDW7975132.1 ATP-dependent DNA helicase RecG [Leptospiraceae bacterium]